MRLGKDKEAEVALNTAAATIESIAAALKTDGTYTSKRVLPQRQDLIAALARAHQHDWQLERGIYCLIG
jgi:hypothetical protein